MPTRIHLPTCLTEVYKYLFPTIDFSRVKIYDGIPFYLNAGAGQYGITIGSVGLSADINVYLKEGSYNNTAGGYPTGACNFETFLQIAHELVHVLQIQDGLGKGYIPGEWVYKYVACFVGWFEFSVTRDNRFEKEAYDFSDGFPGTNGGRLRNCIATSFQSMSPCECSQLPWYRRTTINGETLLTAIQKNCPDIVKRSSNVSGSWKCSLNPIAIVIGLVAAVLSIFGLTNTGGVIGTGVGIVGGAIIGGYYGAVIGALFGPVGLVIGIIVGALIGAIIGGIVGGAIGSAIDWFVGLFTSPPGNRTWFTLYDGADWMVPDVPISKDDHTRTNEGPALAVYNNRLYMTYKGVNSNDIWYNYFAPNAWLAQDIKITTGGHTKTNRKPALAVYNGRLYMAYKSGSSNDLWYNYFDGSNWLSQDIKITTNGHTQTSAGPALAEYNGRLYMAYKAGSSTDIWYNYFDGSNWLSQDIKITANGHTKTSASPALAVYNGRLYMAYKSGSNNDLWYNYFDGSNWLPQDIKITANGHTYSSGGPALVVYNGRLYMVYKSGTTKDVWYNYFDGNSWLPQDI